MFHDYVVKQGSGGNLSYTRMIIRDAESVEDALRRLSAWLIANNYEVINDYHAGQVLFRTMGSTVRYTVEKSFSI